MTALPTVLLWLLLSTSDYKQPIVLVERFVTLEECERVRKVVQPDGYDTSNSARLWCVQAHVYKDPSK